MSINWNIWKFSGSSWHSSNILLPVKIHLKHALKLEGIVSKIVKKYLNLQCRGSIVHSWLWWTHGPWYCDYIAEHSPWVWKLLFLFIFYSHLFKSFNKHQESQTGMIYYLILQYIMWIKDWLMFVMTILESHFDNFSLVSYFTLILYYSLLDIYFFVFL